MLKRKYFIVLFLSCFWACVSAPPKEYKGAELFSLNTVHYGRFEIRMKMVSRSGVVSSFYIFNRSWKELASKWREIDIEIVGREKNLFLSNIITGRSSKRIMSKKTVTLKNIDDAYHVYAIEWTPDYIAWYVDGKLLRKDTAEKNRQVKKLRDIPLTYHMNLWISSAEKWAGKFNKKELPLYQIVNWIKYYKYTPDNSGSDFTLDWTDNFARFDPTRWGKGDWTFEENMVDFAPENVIVKDGYLILRLTKSVKQDFPNDFPRDNKK